MGTVDEENTKQARALLQVLGRAQSDRGESSPNSPKHTKQEGTTLV